MNQLRLLDTTRTPPLSPRQMELSVVDVVTACKLNAQWHSRLPIIDWSNVVRNPDYICYGALYLNEWYAIAIWSSPVAQNRFNNPLEILELRRLAIPPDAPKYTATWILAKMVRDIKKRLPHINRLISYQDTEVHSGTIYKAGNWQPINKSKGILWTTNKRQRNKEQTEADKIRWEFVLKKQWS